MQNTTKNIGADWYLSKQLDFDKKMIGFRYRTLKPHIKGPVGLELGPAEGEMTKYLVDDFEILISVDGAPELLDLIPAYENHIKIHSYFENYEPDRAFDTIIMEHILEHVTDPVMLLSRAKKWLKPGGVMLLGVPNALSLHRLAAVKMGLLKAPYELNARDHELGHQRVYDMQSFTDDIKKAGLHIKKTGGVFLKPLSNKQMEDNWDDRMIEGFFELGHDFPEHAAEIYAVCTA